MSDTFFNDQDSDLSKTLDCVKQITRDFESLTVQFRRDNVMAATLNIRSQGLGSRIPSQQKNTVLPEGAQRVGQSLARKKALGKQLIDDVAIFSRTLNRWATDIEESKSPEDGDSNGNESPRYSAADRMAEAGRLEQLAQSLLEKAQEEEEEANLAVWEYGMGDEYQRHKLAVKNAKNASEEMRRRATILKHGEEGTYRKLMLDLYGVNNPDLNSIAVYFAERFNDRETLEWLRHQHPAPQPHFDFNSLAMMILSDRAVQQLPPIESSRIADGPLPPNYRAVVYVLESSLMMEEAPSAYQDMAAANRYGMAPRLSSYDLLGEINVKFDGVDVSTSEMVDRKLNVVDTKKFVRGALRQSVTAARNGFNVRWEVPNAGVQAKAERILSTNGIRNIRVVIKSW